MSFEKIDNLTIEDTLYTLLSRMMDLSLITDGEPLYTLKEDEELEFYDRIIIHKSLVLPSLKAIKLDLKIYKKELRAKEQERLDEIARVKDIRDRFDAISDIHPVMQKTGRHVANPKIELKRIIKENDVERLNDLEEKAKVYDAELKKTRTEQVKEEGFNDFLISLRGCWKILMEQDKKSPGLVKDIITGLVPSEAADKEAIDKALIKYLKSKGL